MYVPPVENERRESCDKIAQHDQQIIKPGQNSVPDQVFPDDVIAVEVKVKRFIIGSIAQVMTEMALPQQMKRSGEQ